MLLIAFALQGIILSNSTVGVRNTIDTDSIEARCEQKRHNIDQCLSEEFVREDSALRAQERDVRKKLLDGEHVQKLLNNRIKQHSVVRFDSAVKFWRLYREQQCRSVYDAFADGSIAPVVGLECNIRLTRERRDDLRNMYSLTGG